MTNSMTPTPDPAAANTPPSPSAAAGGDLEAVARPLRREPFAAIASLDGTVKEPLICLTVPERDAILAALPPADSVIRESRTTASGGPTCREVRIVNGECRRFIEHDDKGEVWEILGPDASPVSPDLMDRVRAVLIRARQYVADMPIVGDADRDAIDALLSELNAEAGK